jgi:hypothetical protein
MEKDCPVYTKHICKLQHIDDLRAGRVVATRAASPIGQSTIWPVYMQVMFKQTSPVMDH